MDPINLTLRTDREPPAATPVGGELSAAELDANFLALKAAAEQLNGQFREKLSAARTYYVRTDGSDSNDGLSNTSGGAFLTIQKAIDVAASLDNGGFGITIQVGAGTYVANNILKTFVGSGVINITGAGDTTVIAPNVTGPCFGDSVSSGGWLGIYDITSMKLAPTADSCWGIGGIWGAGGIAYFGSINFAFVGAAGQHISVGRGGFVGNKNRNYTITNGGASMSMHTVSYDGGQIRTQSCAVTLAGTPSFTNAFAYAARGGTVLANANTYTGGATGPRYGAALAGGVLTNGGATYLPGDSAGTATSPGWYA